MKSIIKIAFLLFLLPSIFLFSQEKDLGVGVILGEPSGFSAKYWTSENNAIDLGVGYSFVSSGLSINFDYLYHLNNLITSDNPFPVYYGFGVSFRFSQDESNVFGVRGVVGVLWYPENLPIDLFAEFAPSFRLLPNTAIDFAFGIGGRYYIKL